MTRIARDGRDSQFSHWLRKNNQLDSINVGLDVNDVDYCFHKYKQYVNKNREVTRTVKFILNLEVKIFGANLSNSQHETLFILHQMLCNIGKSNNKYYILNKKKVSVWHYGYYICRLIGGDNPANAKNIMFGRFDKDGELIDTEIDESILTNILAFNIRPDNFLAVDTRLHHKTMTYYQEIYDPLWLFGKRPVLITKRS